MILKNWIFIKDKGVPKAHPIAVFSKEDAKVAESFANYCRSVELTGKIILNTQLYDVRTS